jgi:hypothetical protein
MESDFDQKVAALRPATPAKKASRKKKADCTAEEWAGHLNYGAIVNAKYEAANYERRREMDRQRHWRDLEKRRASSRQSRARHLEKRRDYDRERYAADPQKRIANSSRANKKRLLTDDNFRMQCRLRKRLYMAARNHWKAGSAVHDLGCTIEELWAHLEFQFQPGMNRANWGTAWEIDHFYPLTAADLGDRVQFLAVNNWRNLRPMTPAENDSKDNKVFPEAQILFDQLCQEFSHGN